MKVRSLHIITDLDCGGAESMLVRLCSCAEAGSVAVLALKSPGHFEKDLKEMGIPLYSLEMQGRVPLPIHVRRLKAILAELQPDIYWGWMYHGALVATVARFLRPAPLLWNFRQTLDTLRRERFTTSLVIRLLRLLRSVPQRIVYNAPLSFEQHRALGFTTPEQIIVNGFADSDFFESERVRTEARKRYSIPENALVIGHASRHHPMKDHQTFFQAVAPLFSEHPQLLLLCCGYGVSEDIVPEGIPREKIRLIGVESHMNSFYNAIDVFCSSSAWGEGFPNVVGEALLVGVPCVVTDVGYARIIVGEWGRVVPPEDGENLREGIRRELEILQSQGNPEKDRRRTSIQEKYSLSAVAREYQSLEDSLLI